MGMLVGLALIKALPTPFSKRKIKIQNLAKNLLIKILRDNQAVHLHGTGHKTVTLGYNCRNGLTNFLWKCVAYEKGKEINLS